MNTLNDINLFLTNNAAIWGFIGFVLTSFATIVGLVVTFRQAQQAKANSEQAKTSSELTRAAAEEATKQVKQGFAQVDTMVTLNAAAALIERIYDSQSREEWDRVPEFYKDVRKLLAETLGEASALNESDRKQVQAATSEFATIEKSVQNRYLKGIAINEVDEINGIITNHLTELIRIRANIGRRKQT